MMEQFLEIFAGYYAVQLICAVFVYGVGEFLPHALPVMKYVGAAYILWLVGLRSGPVVRYSQMAGNPSCHEVKMV